MKANQLEQIKVHANAIAKLPYTEIDSEQVKTLEGIEETVRKHLIYDVTARKKGRILALILLSAFSKALHL